MWWGRLPGRDGVRVVDERGLFTCGVICGLGVIARMDLKMLRELLDACELS